MKFMMTSKQHEINGNGKVSWEVDSFLAVLLLFKHVSSFFLNWSKVHLSFVFIFKCFHICLQGRGVEKVCIIQTRSIIIYISQTSLSSFNTLLQAKVYPNHLEHMPMF
jgi:hypothetical protein